ncbi:unnamed protein product [Knipowitschia caucasica]
MTKITEKLLIERGSPKSSQLEQIHSLDLSNMGLGSEDLPLALMSRLRSLQRLDLSRNRLRQFPGALLLPALTHLDLSDNQMEEVCSLQHLVSLQELLLEDNLYITVSDNHKLMVLLPQLHMFNGKDVTATANHLRYVYTDNLRSRIMCVWQKSFQGRSLSTERTETLEAEFVQTATQQVRYGPSSVSDFTKWRVGIMAAEFFKFQIKETKESSPLHHENVTRLKRKREASPAAPTKHTPTASPRAGPTASPKAGPTASPKAGPTASPRAGPTASPRAGPTASPRAGPTASPRAGPTASPRAGPTASPRAGPTASPRAGPTTCPRAGPTTCPRAGPTTCPRAGPTTCPRAGPTTCPRAGPTTCPRAGPTTCPRAGPTTCPRAGPTTSPRAGPTSSPRAGPTASPRAGPTASPRAGLRTSVSRGKPALSPHKTTPKSASKTREDRVSQQPSKRGAPHSKTQDQDHLLQEQSPVCLRTHHVLQCHSKQDSSEDLSTQLWACAFQPSSSGSSCVVATCGGDSVCLIDCELGLVMKKYKVPGEEFFSLAWSCILMSCGRNTPAQPCSVLAAGGKRGVVKLIHPRNNVAYGEFRASRKALSVLRFNPNKGNFLYTGSYDNKIVLWDIGGLDNHYNYKVLPLMTLECSSTPLHLCLPPTAALSHLLSACDQGLLCHSRPQTSTTSRWQQREVTFPVYDKVDSDHDYHTVDGLCFLSDDIVASKNHLHSRIYLWSWSQTMCQQKGTRKSSSVRAVVLAELQWASTQVPYLALSTCPGRSYVVCGDDKGRLWTYHVRRLEDQSITTQVVEWPAPHKGSRGPLEGPSINCVTMDPELRYLVALTDRNMVLVWKSEA